MADTYLPFLGAALRRWRTLNRVKQAHAAELLGVAQTTISRWETASVGIDPAHANAVERLIARRPNPAADHALRRLVIGFGGAAHLICDLTHRLLAASPTRQREFGADATALIGQSLWPFATGPIMAHERTAAAQTDRGAVLAPPIEFDTGANGSSLVPIAHSRCRWTWLMLSDGGVVRLVETLSPR